MNRRVSRWARGLLILGLCVLPMTVAPGCNLGPFPDFLEQLDPLDPVKGEVKGWILAQEDQTHVLVLSKSGRFLHSVVGRDTSVRLDFGTFTIQRSEIRLQNELRYTFPTESGGVNSREGAQSKPLDKLESRPAVMQEDRLEIDGWGTFIGTDDYLAGLDLSTRDGRGCLLKLIQLSIRTAQSRIRNLGSGGTVIYHNNKSTFAGFLSGEESIVVENLLSPDTTISYDNFRDFPEVRLDGFVLSHVNTSGDGSLEQAVRYRISAQSGLGEGLGGGAGAGGLSQEPQTAVLAEGRLIYGPADSIQIEQADVVGGSYDFEMEFPSRQTDNFDWTFLADLDLRGCYSLRLNEE